MSNTLTAPPAVQKQWPPPNFINPETEGPALLITSIVLAAVGLLVVILRLFSRLFLTKAPGLDDFLMVIALALCIAVSVLLIIGLKQWYVGYHIWDLPAESVVDHRRGMWILSYIYILASGCIKISVLLFYRRLSVTFSSPFLIATWIGIAYNASFMIAYCVANSLICSPIQAYWMRYDLVWRTSNNWSCGNEAISLPANGALSVFGDLYSTVIPLILVMNLDLPRKQKWALYSLFAVGFAVVAAGGVRTYYLIYMTYKTYDFTWVVYKVWLWSVVELYSAIIAASAPALKPLLRRILGESFLGNSYKYGNEKSADSGTSADHAVDLDRVRSDRRSGWSLASLTTRKKLADLEDKDDGAEEDMRLAKNGASLANHESVISDSDTYENEQGALRSGRNGQLTWKPAGKHSSTLNSTVTEEEIQNMPLSSSYEVDPPIYPDNVARASHQRHRQMASDSTIGTAITTDERVEASSLLPTSHSRQTSHGDGYGWQTPISKAQPINQSHPPSAYRGPPLVAAAAATSARSDKTAGAAKRRSWGTSHASKLLNQVRMPFYDAESSHELNPARPPFVAAYSNTSSGFNSEAGDERRDDPILTAAQQSRLSNSTNNGTVSDVGRDSGGSYVVPSLPPHRASYIRRY